MCACILCVCVSCVCISVCVRVCVSVYGVCLYIAFLYGTLARVSLWCGVVWRGVCKALFFSFFLKWCELYLFVDLSRGVTLTE